MDQPQQPQPASSPVPAPSFTPSVQNPIVIDHKHRPIVGGAFVIVVLTLSILAGGLLFINYWPSSDEPIVAVTIPRPSTTPTSTSTPVTDIPADWKTYINTEYGFEFWYPVDFTVIQSGVATNASFTVALSSLDWKVAYFTIMTKGEYKMRLADPNNYQQTNVIAQNATHVAGYAGPQECPNTEVCQTYQSAVDLIRPTFKFTEAESATERQVRNAIEKVLTTGVALNPNEPMPKGIQLISVDVETSNITLNFSKEITSKGQAAFEDVFSLVSNAIHPIIQGTGTSPKYSTLNISVLVKGRSITEYFK